MDRTIYQECLEAGFETDHHESDLYVLDTPEARAVFGKHGKKVALTLKEKLRGEAGGPFLERFLSDKDGRHWIDVPFGYDPFWKRG